MLSIQDRNLAITDGGDTVLRMWLFWGLWCDLGAGHSLDARRGVRSSGRGWGLRFVRVQLAIIYLVSALSKTGLSWRRGTAIYYALASTGFTRPSGVWLISRPALTAALTFLTLAIELTLPVLILSPIRRGACRAAAIALGVSLHVGIATAMRVGIFPFVMLAGFTALVQPAWLDRWAPALGPAIPPEREVRRPSRLGRGATACGHLALRIAPLLVLMAILVEQGARLAHRSSPRLVSRALNLVEVHQNWSMFAPEPSHASGRFEAPGLLADGSSVDLAESAAPGLRPHFGWGYSRWEKLGLTLRDPGNPYLVPFGRFLCRRYNGDTTGPRLASFTLVLVLSPTPEPGAPTKAPSPPGASHLPRAALRGRAGSHCIKRNGRFFKVMFRSRVARTSTVSGSKLGVSKVIVCDLPSLGSLSGSEIFRPSMRTTVPARALLAVTVTCSRAATAEAVRGAGASGTTFSAGGEATGAAFSTYRRRDDRRRDDRRRDDRRCRRGDLGPRRGGSGRHRGRRRGRRGDGGRATEGEHQAERDDRPRAQGHSRGQTPPGGAGGGSRHGTGIERVGLAPLRVAPPPRLERRAGVRRRRCGVAVAIRPNPSAPPPGAAIVGDVDCSIGIRCGRSTRPVPPPTAARSRSRSRSSIVCWRSSGRLASIRRTTVSSSAGTDGSSSRNARGASNRCAPISSPTPSRTKGGPPVSMA